MRGKNQFVVLLLAVCLVLVGVSFVLGAHTSRSNVETTVNQSQYYFWNISVNNTGVDAGGNITILNITLPSGISFVNDLTNGSTAFGSFSNNSNTLTWTNNTEYLINGSKNDYSVNASANFWFNTTIAFTLHSGYYNITIRSINTSGGYAYSESNVSIRVNDITLPYNISFTTLTPSNGSYLSQKNISVNVTSTDNEGISTFRIYLWNVTGLVNNTNISSAALAATEYAFINFTSLPDNVYYLNLTVNDTSGNENVTSEFRTITLDTTLPLVSNNSGSTVNGTNLSQNWIYFNVSVAELNTKNITFLLYNETGLKNLSAFTMSSNVTNNTLNWTGLSDGVYTYNATVIDLALNSNTSITRTVKLDTTPSLVSFISPITATNYSRGFVAINISANDTTGVGVERVFLNVTNSTGTQVNATYLYQAGTTIYWNSTLNVSLWGGDGLYNITIFANDTLNNLNSTTRIQLTVDSAAPVVTLISPANAASSTSTSWEFTYNVTDSVSTNCSLILDGIIANTSSSINVSGGTGTFTNSSSVGSHTWSINCTDSANNAANSSTRSFSVTTVTTTNTATSGGSAITAVPFWTSTYTISDEQFQNGFSQNLGTRGRIKFIFNGSEHLVGIVNMTETSATINISSTPQQAVFNIGDTKKFELTNDSYYDVKVTLNSIASGKANVSIVKISELIPVVSTPTSPQTTTEKIQEKISEITEQTEEWKFWAVIILIAIVIVVVVYLVVKKMKK